MATIKRIVPSAGVSDFRQVAPAAGGGFRLLAEGLAAAYDRLKPAAIGEMAEQGAELGREIARGQIGDPQGAVYASSSGGGAPGDPRYRNAIASIESAGSGDYAAIGPTHAKMGRALGRYQIMETNIGPWGREALGRDVSAEEFMASPAIQDAIFDHKFGSYVGQFGEAGAAQAWFAGPGGVGKTDRKDVLGTTVGSYGEKFMRALGAGGDTITASSMGGAPAFAPTMLREADGKLTSRLFSPMAGEILQAHDAAAGVAYLSDVTMKGVTDLMSMSEQFALNPDGFRQAADEYLREMTKSAPAMFRSDVRASLEKEVQRRTLGLMEERQRDTRQRAANSSAALADMWGDNLSAAIAGGNPEEIVAAQSELSSILTARQRLPGIAWTPEQSANFVRKAEQEGQRRIEAAKKEQAATWKGELNTIIGAAKDGRNAADESILQNPAVVAAHPELAREAQAFTILRDEMPSFMTMPPAAQAQALIDMRAQPVTEEWEVDLYGAAEKAATANAAAWKDDPIKRAGEVLPDSPPPPLEMSLDDPAAFTASLTARADYAQRLADAGYTERPVFVSKEEAQAVGAMFGKEIPPELKAIAAGAVVSALGDQSGPFFDQIKNNDPVTRMSGMLMAKGGDSAVALEAMQGQALLDQGLVQAPTKANSLASVDTDIAAALAGVPIGAQGDLLKTATAIYATRARGVVEKDAQMTILKESMQSALGQSSRMGDGAIIGGVQTVGERPVLLPPNMSGTDLDGALNAAFGRPMADFWSAISWDIDTSPRGLSTELWTAAGGGVPALGGEPIDRAAWDRGEVLLTPMGGTKYSLSIVRNGVIIDARRLGDGSGMPFVFDAQVLVDENRRPK